MLTLSGILANRIQHHWVSQGFNSFTNNFNGFNLKGKITHIQNSDL